MNIVYGVVIKWRKPYALSRSQLPISVLFRFSRVVPHTQNAAPVVFCWKPSLKALSSPEGDGAVSPCIWGDDYVQLPSKWATHEWVWGGERIGKEGTSGKLRHELMAPVWDNVVKNLHKTTLPRKSGGAWVGKVYGIYAVLPTLNI